MRYILAFMMGIFVQTMPSVAHNWNPLDPREQETKDPLKEENTEEERGPNSQFSGK